MNPPLHHFILAAILIILLPSLTAKDYCISATGKDSNAGSQTAPWRTLAKLSAAQLRPGDRVLLRGGDTFAAPLTICWSGSASAPITFTSYGTGRATIQSTGAKDHGIVLGPHQHLTIQNLRLLGPGFAASSASGVDAYLYGPSPKAGISLLGLDISGFANAIKIGAWASGTGVEGLLIDGCELHDNREGLFLYGKTITDHRKVMIRRCVAFNNHGNPDPKTAPNGNSILVNGVTDCRIEQCLVRDGGDQGGGGVGIWTYGADRVTIAFCEVHHQKAVHSSDGGGFDLDGGVTNSVIQSCYSHDNDGAGFLVYQNLKATTAYQANAGNAIRNNVSINDGRRRSYAGIVVDSEDPATPIGGCDITGNTIFTATICPDGAARCLSLGARVTGIRVRDNRFIAGNGRTCLLVDHALDPTQALFQGNLYGATTGTTLALKWGTTTYPTVAAWTAATGQESQGAVPWTPVMDRLVTTLGQVGCVATSLADVQTLDRRLAKTGMFLHAGDTPEALRRAPGR